MKLLGSTFIPAVNNLQICLEQSFTRTYDAISYFKFRNEEGRLIWLFRIWNERFYTTKNLRVNSHSLYLNEGNSERLVFNSENEKEKIRRRKSNNFLFQSHFSGTDDVYWLYAAETFDIRSERKDSIFKIKNVVEKFRHVRPGWHAYVQFSHCEAIGRNT